MLVVMAGAGSAFQYGIMSNVEGMATNSCFFYASRTSVPYKGFKKGRQWDLKYEDYTLAKQKVPDILYSSPIVDIYGVKVVKGEKTGSYRMMGCFPEYRFIEANKLIQGRYINEIDIQQKRKVCIIGNRVYEEMFGRGRNALGEKIQVNGVSFQIIGVWGQSNGMFMDPNEVIMTPLPTMQQIFGMGNTIHWILATAKPNIKASEIQKQISDLVKQRNHIAPEDEIGFSSFNIEEMFNMWKNLFLGISALVWIVGLGTLLAGGIGISNIMLVTVRERTKEIGIRRALGATPRNIIIQIMSESIVLTLIAGVAGLMLGVGILQLVGTALENSDGFFKNPQISFGISIAALFILLIIGTIAGYMPARRAMKIKPIEAIHEE